MKLFKKHKAKEKTILNVGIQECRTCEKNIRCAECFHLKENEVLNEEVEKLKSEKEELTKAYRESQVSNLRALEKQIPEKVKDDGWLYCPICGRDVLMDRFDYCPDCGQALDWSDNMASFYNLDIETAFDKIRSGIDDGTRYFGVPIRDFLAFLVNIEGCEVIGNVHDNPELLRGDNNA